MTDEPRPHLSSYTDRHDKRRWRFRKGKTVKSIPGQPGEPEFEERYLALIEGRKPNVAQVVRLPGAAIPESFRAAWKKVLKTREWLQFDPATISKNTRLAEEFLNLPLVENNPALWGDMLVKDLKRRHVKEILARFNATPHKAKHLLVTIRKMIVVALDEEWVEIDPTWKLSYRPEYVGWRAWTQTEQEMFEKRWPVGTAARTVYGIALWLGNRRSDVARLEWSWFDWKNNTVTIQTKKGKKVLVLPITPMLREVLEPLPREKEHVLLNGYGVPFSEKSLTGMMAHWTQMAGMPKGCTIHGLRKTLGKMLAESGATTRQLMDTLGHDDIAHAELYSREAEQERLARDGMSRVTKMRKTKKSRG